nr:hypothetical protein [Tanacetum cinerariifolium]
MLLESATKEWCLRLFAGDCEFSGHDAPLKPNPFASNLARQAKAVKDFSTPACKLRPQELKDGRIGYEEFQVRMKEGAYWRKVSLGSFEAYIANDTISTLHLQRKPEDV